MRAEAHSPPHVGWEIMEAEDHLAPRHPCHVHGAKRRMLEGMEAAFEIIEVAIKGAMVAPAP